MPGARFNFAELQGGEAFDAEALACEAAVTEPYTIARRNEFAFTRPSLGKIAHKPPGEAVAAPVGS